MQKTYDDGNEEVALVLSICSTRDTIPFVNITVESDKDDLQS